MRTERGDTIEAVLGGSLLVRYERESGQRASEAVFDAVEASGVDLIRADDRLDDAVDGDALDRLFDGRSGGLVTFECWDRRVVVRPSAVLVLSAE